MSCVYTYKGKDFTTKEELKKELREELVGNRLQDIKKTAFTLQGYPSDLKLQKELIAEEAVIQYGTDEFIGFEIEGTNMTVTIDGRAIEQINSKEKLLFNRTTGKYEEYDMEELLAKEKRGEKIPNILSWKAERKSHYAKKAWDKIWNAKPETPVQDKGTLKEKLYAFAQSIGVKVETIEEYLKENAFRKDTVDEDVQGLADMLTKTIAVANTEDLEQLTEEIAHFAIEYNIDQEIIDRMLDRVDQTQAYQAEADAYRVKYGEQTLPDGTKLTAEQLEKKVRKEILGKILAEKIKDNFNTEFAQNSAEIGIFTQLGNLWNRFINLFKINDTNEQFFREFGKTLDNLAYQVTTVQEKQFKPWESQEVYFSMTKKDKEIHKKVHDNITKVVEQLKGSYRNVINQKGIEKSSRKIKLDNLASQLTMHQYGKVINSIISILEDDINNTIILINKAKQQEGAIIDNLKDYDVLNAINFDRSFDLFSVLIGNELRSFKGHINKFNLEGITEEDIDNLQSRLELIEQQYGSIRGSMKQINSEKGRRIVEDFYRKLGASEDVITDILEDLDSTYKNVNWLTENVMPFKDISNPIFQAIHSLMVIATSATERAANFFAREFSNKVLKHKLTDELVMKLKAGYSMINPQHTQHIVDYLGLLEEDYKTQIEEIDDQISKTTNKEELNKLQKKKSDLMLEEGAALEAQKREWLEQAVKDERLKELDEIGQLARDVIFKRALDKRRLLDKYRLPDGTVAFESISNADFAELAQIESNFKANMSPYHRDGSLKDGLELDTAKDLLKYRNDIIKSNDDVTYRTKDFAEAAKKQGIIFKQTAQGLVLKTPIRDLTTPQLRWLQSNAIYNYPEDVRDLLDAEGGATVDPIFNVSQSVMDEIFASLDIRFEVNGKVYTELPNKQNKYSKENYQAIYDSLIAKRQSLIAPYKEVGKVGEIDGTLLSRKQTPQVLQALDTVNRHIRAFKLQELDGISISYEGNDAYNRKIEQLQNNPDALREFKNSEAKVDWIDGEERPTAYHYRRTVIRDANEQVLSKVYQPNLKWQNTESLEDFFNQKYNRDLSGKTVQLKLDNKKLDEKIPEDVVKRLKEKHAKVENGMTFREAFINKDFFTTFGVDQKTDFWGQKGANINKGLWELRDYLLAEKEQVDNNYGVFNQLYLLPQTQATFKEMREKGVMKAMRAQFGLDFLQENDDTILGDKDRVTVPKRYINKLPHPDLISDDLSRLYGKYTEAGANFKNKNEILPKIQILRERLKNSSVEDATDVAGTRLFKMLDRWLSVHLYGNLVDELGGAKRGIEKIKKLEEVTPEALHPVIHTISKVSPAKALRQLYSYMRNTNLGLHIVTPTVGAISTAVYDTMEKLSENQVSKDSITWAAGKMAQHYAQHVRDSGSIAPKGHLMKLLRYSNIHITPEKMYDGVSKSVVYRTMDEPLFLTYRPTTVISAGTAAFSIFDSYRLIEGEFRNVNNHRDFRREQGFSEEGINEEWAAAKEQSYYNFLKEGSDNIELDLSRLKTAGYFQGINKLSEIKDRADTLEDKLRANAQRYWFRIESQASPLDKPLAFTSPFLMFAGMHSQYFFNFLSHRFSSKRYNLIENRYEEGNYVTVGRLFWENLTDNSMSPTDKALSLGNMFASLITFGMYNEGLKGLEEYEQTNVKRAGVDVAMYVMLTAMFILVSMSADDDEDNWAKQYMAIIAARALLEQGSQMLPTAGYDFINRLSSPIAGQRLLEGWANIPFWMTEKYGKEIDSGTYKGMTRRERDFLRLTFLKNVYQPVFSDYRLGSIYFRNNSIQFPNAMLETAKEIRKDINEN